MDDSILDRWERGNNRQHDIRVGQPTDKSEEPATASNHADSPPTQYDRGDNMARDPKECCSDCGVVYGALAYENAEGKLTTISRSELAIVNRTLKDLGAKPVKRAQMAAFRQVDEEANGSSSGEYTWTCCNFCVYAVDTEGLYDLEE